MEEFFNHLRELAQLPGGQQALTSLTAAGAVAVSLITAIAAPVVSILVARRQIRATVVSANRHKWISELQQVVAELLGMDFVLTSAPSKHGDFDLSVKVLTWRYRLSVLLDSSKPSHAVLDKLVDDMIMGYDSKQHDKYERIVEAARIVVIEQMQMIGKGQ